MSLQLLLSQISAISEKYDHLYRKTGQYFNIFEIANISSAEVKMCRVLHELLNPQGSHHQGDLYLRLFTKHVLDLEFSEEEYRAACVFREYLVKDDKRIDLVIKTNTRLIPIEVKIRAEDQRLQCQNYVVEAKNSKLFYLTLFGTPPSADSAGNLRREDHSTDDNPVYEQVTTISFKHHIIVWLTECLRQDETIRLAPIREVLLQLLSVVRKLTDQLEEGKEMEIVKTLVASRANMISAVEIAQSLEGSKVEMMKKVFVALEQGLSERDRLGDKISNTLDYQWDNYSLIRSYYGKKASSRPGISYSIKSQDKPGVDLRFRVEIDHRIFAGLYLPNVNDRGGQKSPWAYWEYIPVHEPKTLSPNFKEHDDAYFNLFDEQTFEHFITQSLERIDIILDKRGQA